MPESDQSHHCACGPLSCGLPRMRAGRHFSKGFQFQTRASEPRGPENCWRGALGSRSRLCTQNLRITLPILFDVGRLPTYNLAINLNSFSLAAIRKSRLQVENVNDPSEKD